VGEAELEAMAAVKGALERLSPSARARVWQWVGETLEISWRARPLAWHGGERPLSAALADLVFDAQPRNGPEHALVAAYFLQECQGHVPWGGGDLNDALKELGRGLGNVTRTLSALGARRPALVMQVSRTGRGTQARNGYKLTTAGVEQVGDMLGRGSARA